MLIQIVVTRVSKNNNTKTPDGLEVQLLRACAGVCGGGGHVCVGVVRVGCGRQL